MSGRSPDGAARRPYQCTDKKRFHLELKVERERHRAADVCYAVIKDTVVRLAPGQRARRAGAEIFRHPEIGAEREDLAHIHAIAIVIITHEEAPDGVERQGPRQVDGVPGVEIEVIPARRLGLGMDADIRVRADRELLRPAETKRKLGADEERMIREEIVETALEGEAVVIVLGAQTQVVQLRQNIGDARPEIGAAEIELAKAIVVEKLLLRSDRGKKRLRDPRRVGDAGRRRDEDVALLTSLRERYVRGVIKRHSGPDREGLVTFDPLENFLLAEVGIIRALDGVAFVHSVLHRVRIVMHERLVSQKLSAIDILARRLGGAGRNDYQERSARKQSRQETTAGQFENAGHYEYV